MQVSTENIEIPDTCPLDCVFSEDLKRFGQGAACVRCPVFNCADSESLCKPEHYRADWAREWDLFFKKIIPFPQLLL